MVTLPLETFPQHKAREYMRKSTLSLDYLQTQYTDLLCKLSCHDCW